MCQKSLREYNELPDLEKKQVWLDMSGVGVGGVGGVENTVVDPNNPNHEEKQSCINQHLENLEEELEDLIRRSEKNNITNDADKNDSNNNSNNNDLCQALKVAMNQNSGYVHDKTFRLKFLRAEHFDTKKAANRMAMYFQEKRQLFGLDKLTKEIELSDLNEYDLQSLHLGFLQILPRPDHANRKILFYYKALTNCYKERENIVSNL